MKAQEQERIRIAGELHDGVMQEMLAVTMMLGTVKRRIREDPAATATIDSRAAEAGSGGHGSASAVSRPASAPAAGGGIAEGGERLLRAVQRGEQHSRGVRCRRETSATCHAAPPSRCFASSRKRWGTPPSMRPPGRSRFVCRDPMAWSR